MISIDWQFLVAIVLLTIGAGGTLFLLGKQLYKFFWNPFPEESARGADDPAPPGAIEWVEDICIAMGSAPSTSILNSLRAGQSRDQARAARIVELQKP